MPLDNPPAFPCEVITGVAYDHEQQRNVHDTQPTPGMTLRDYFAAKALQGICASGPSADWSDARIANDAYALADEMLKARAL